MGTVNQSTRCSGCGQPLAPSHAGPCPNCGDTRKTHDVSVRLTAHAHVSFGWQHIHEYYERHRLLLPLVIIVTIGSPFLGLVLAGWAGVLAGLIVSCVTFILGLRAVTKVREMREGHET
jgi:predicted RNA-binding Zn-ribbon protein involved in translation (DUF1610 family)